MFTGLLSAREPTMDATALATDTIGDLRELLGDLPDGVLLLDRGWRLIYANRKAQQISRIEPAHLNGPTLWELYPTLLGSDLEPFFRRVMAGGPAELTESFYEPFDIWVKLRFSGTGFGLAVYYNDITDLKTSNKARDAALAQLQQVFDTTTDAIFSLDREWRFVFLNRKAKALLSSEDPNLVGENLWHRFPATIYDGSPYVHTYHRAMNENIPGEFVAFYPAPLNLWLRVEARPSEGGIIVFFRDITQQRKDEEALRANEQRYRVLTELNPQALWTGTPDGKVNYANQRFLDYIGHDFVPVDGTEYLSCFFIDDREHVLKTWMHSVQTGEEYSIDARLTRACDGAHRWWHLRALPLRDEHGQITLWLGVATDVHEQRTIAEVLHLQQVATEQQRAELEAVYQTAPIGLALFDPVDFRYLRVNERQAEILGRTKEEILGRHIHELVPFATLDGFIEQIARGEVIRNHISRGEFPNQPGEQRTFNVNYSPVFKADGSLGAISAAIFEITQQRKAEAALVQSEKLAAVGRLASSISHEINNPLEAVTNLLYLAGTEEGLPLAAKHYIDTAQTELTRVSQIATQTLRFHRQANAPSRVTPAQLIDAVLNLYQGRLSNSGIRVEACYSTTASICCFENDIRQVLNNLIGNAIDAMRTGGRLRIRAHDAKLPNNGSRGVRITVADTGHGMSGETVRRIFEPFFTTKQLNGTGLGLWISAGIVDRHGGQLRVRSSQNAVLHGTVFTLLLPVEAICV